MALTQAEFEALLSDATKHIEADIVWQRDEDHSPCWEFRAEVRSDSGWPLFVRGSFNPLIPALSYMLILKTEGRIYGLDLGKDHHNPQCNPVGECHKHRWTERFRDKEAYVPDDITASAAQPVDVWRQFCAEARINHQGSMIAPPPATGELFV
ncbi:MAG: hypothetical protein NZ533_11055 [Casimicrobiaceae bacterium]|nr:hypothetical protein [Casimicrobiaceae bacterium]